MGRAAGLSPPCSPHAVRKAVEAARQELCYADPDALPEAQSAARAPPPWDSACPAQPLLQLHACERRDEEDRQPLSLVSSRQGRNPSSLACWGRSCRLQLRAGGAALPEPESAACYVDSGTARSSRERPQWHARRPAQQAVSIQTQRH